MPGVALQFPVSGVEANPIFLLAAAFAISLLAAPAGVSGAFLLLPFQVSVLGFTAPAVSPTNLIFNIVATPGGIYRYVREGRIVWSLTWTVVVGTLPGVFVGAVLRVKYLADPRAFEVFVGFVLLYLGARPLLEASLRLRGRDRTVAPPAGKVETTLVSARRIAYEFAGERFSFGTAPVLVLSFVVGIVGGIYAGARAQKYLPDLWIRTVLGTLVILLALRYVGGIFGA